MAVVLTVAFLLSLSACGEGRVRVKSVQVINSDFFMDMTREWYHADRVLDPNGVNYKLAQAFVGSYQQFERQFLMRYDANFGLELDLEVHNGTKETITLTGLKVENNGYKDTYVSSKLGYCEEFTLAPGETKTVPVLFLGNGGIYLNEEFINIVFPEMPMQLIYKTASGDEQMEKVKFKDVKVE